MKVAAVVLAAGLSRRFGAANKIVADLGGKPLWRHVHDALASLPLGRRIVVARADGAATWPGYDVVVNDRPEEGMSRSLALGIAAARRHGSDAALVMLADMPFVTADHLRLLLGRQRGTDTLAASSDGTRRSPPALFGRSWFDQLEASTGDEGARALIARAELVVATAGDLRDIDRPADLTHNNA